MDFGQNIEALVRGEVLTTYQKALAKMEYKCWKDEYLKMHEELSKLRQDAVISRRELLLDFAEYSENDKVSKHLDELVDNYLDSIKQ